MTSVDTASERKSYGQECPMATALDFIGDRWTILIIRELLGGPGRFQELKTGLPGIPSNLLAERLRRMESDGIIRYMDVGASGVYTLTEAGAGIRTAIEELGIWGARFGCRVAPAKHERSIRATSMALQAILSRSDALPTGADIIELEVDGGYAEILLGSKPTVTARPAMQPDARLSATTDAISGFLMGEIMSDQAFDHVSGDPGATTRLIEALGSSSTTGRKAVS